MNDEEQFRQLVDRWEDLHEQGQETSVEELCRDFPHLAERLRRWVRLLRASDWLCKPLGDEDGPTVLFNGATSKAPQPCQITTAEFLKNLADSNLLSPPDIEGHSAAPDGRSLANELVAQGKLTAYQADCICRGKTRHLVLGEYVILGVLGSGGMGRVFRALHRKMNRVVALKVLPPSAVDCAESVERFQREIQAVAKLSHPNIVTAHDAGSRDGMYFFAMDLIEGEDLSQCVKEHGPLPVNQALDCVLQVAKGLEYAHGQGVIHRDIKPSNLIVDEGGTVKILDLGVARFRTTPLGADATLTNTGCLLGTVDYMAPEQAINTKLADHRADIYSLGCTLYFLFTGQPVYGGETAMERLLAHRENAIPSLKSACSAAPEWLDAVFQKMVAKKPEGRFQAMSEVIAALAREEIPRSRWLRVAAIGIVAAVVVVMLILSQNDHRIKEDQLVVPAPVENRLPHEELASEEEDWPVPQPVAIPPAEDTSPAQEKAIEWVLSKNGQIDVFTHGRRQVAASKSELPPAPYSVFGVRLLHSKAISDDDLAHLAPLTSVQGMNFRHCALTGVGFRHLVGLANLRDLTLAENPITDDGLREIGKLNQLTTLILSTNKTFTNDGLEHLGGMTHLTLLVLARTRVTDDGLRHLQGVTSLITLELLNTNVSDAGLKHLKGLRNLRSLGVGKTNVTKEGVSQLKACLPQCEIRE
jgi:serine/threonine protein kinase